MSVIESSLLRWESGQCKRSIPNLQQRVEEATRFSSFLGRSRTSLKLLEQTLGGFDDEDGDGDGTPASVMTSKSAVPLLRDLAVDPSTLCKLASSLSKFQRRHPNVVGTWTFLRVAVRLLTSKNAQILKEGQIEDVINLSSTCAAHEVSGPGRDFITRLYTRRAVQHLNNLLNSPKEDSRTVAETLRISPRTTAALIYAFGELSVRYDRTDEKLSTAYKRLRLVTDRRLVSKEQIDRLETNNMVDLLEGVVAMQVVRTDPSTVRIILMALHDRLISNPSSISHQSAVALIQSVVRLRTMVGNVDKPAVVRLKDSVSEEQIAESATDVKTENEPITQSTTTTATTTPPPTSPPTVVGKKDVGSNKDSSVDSMSPGGATNEKDGQVEEVISPDQAEADSVIEQMVDERTNMAEINDLTLQILQDASNISTQTLREMSCADIRRLLVVFATVPVEANELVGRIEDEVTRRYSAANVLSGGNLVHDEVYEDDDDAMDSKESIVRSNRDMDADEGDAFELGRCRELLATYKRINFETKERKSRHDFDRRKHIGKRILKRLFL